MGDDVFCGDLRVLVKKFTAMPDTPIPLGDDSSGDRIVVSSRSAGEYDRLDDGVSSGVLCYDTTFTHLSYHICKRANKWHGHEILQSVSACAHVRMHALTTAELFIAAARTRQSAANSQALPRAARAWRLRLL